MAETKKIPERCDVPEEEKWNLADIYPTDQAWQEDFDATQAMARKLPGYQGRLGESAATLYEYMTLQQEVDSRLENLAEYAQRKSDPDTPRRRWSGFTGMSPGWSTTAAISRSSRTGAPTSCPTRRKSCWPAPASLPPPRTTSTASSPTQT